LIFSIPVIVLIPITSKEKGIPFHVEIYQPEGGLKERSFIKCEDVRSVAKERLYQKLGTVSSVNKRKIILC
jgi:mRNA interferase MazF